MQDYGNGLGKALEIAGSRATLDANAKRLFSNKQIIARFMKALIPEYLHESLTTIMSERLADKLSTTTPSPEFAKPLGTELILPHNDILSLDLLFEAHSPTLACNRQLINIEIHAIDTIYVLRLP